MNCQGQQRECQKSVAALQRRAAAAGWRDLPQSGAAARRLDKVGGGFCPLRSGERWRHPTTGRRGRGVTRPEAAGVDGGCRGRREVRPACQGGCEVPSVAGVKQRTWLAHVPRNEAGWRPRRARQHAALLPCVTAAMTLLVCLGSFTGPCSPLTPQDLASGAAVMEPIRSTSGSVVWANDNRHLVSGRGSTRCGASSNWWGMNACRAQQSPLGVWCGAVRCAAWCVPRRQAPHAPMPASTPRHIGSDPCAPAQCPAAVLCGEGRPGPPLQSDAPQVSRFPDTAGLVHPTCSTAKPRPPLRQASPAA